MNCPLATASGVTPLDEATPTITGTLIGGGGLAPGGRLPGGGGGSVSISVMKLARARSVRAPPEVSSEMLAVTFAGAERGAQLVLPIVVAQAESLRC